MVISKDKVVSVTYELRIDNPEGEIIESLHEDSPLTFLYGAGSLLPKFEANLAGLKTGDSFKFALTAADAYGEVNENAIIDIPISVFEIEGKVDYDLVKIGNSIPMQDGYGNKLTGKVKEVSLEKVKMDFNHPLAGNTLFFTGKVTGIREATSEELAHGHTHNASDCDDDCSDCGSSCGCY